MTNETDETNSTPKKGSKISTEQIDGFLYHAAIGHRETMGYFFISVFGVFTGSIIATVGVVSSISMFIVGGFGLYQRKTINDIIKKTEHNQDSIKPKTKSLARTIGVAVGASVIPLFFANIYKNTLNNADVFAKDTANTTVSSQVDHTQTSHAWRCETDAEMTTSVRAFQTAAQNNTQPSTEEINCVQNKKVALKATP